MLLVSINSGTQLVYRAIDTNYCWRTRGSITKGTRESGYATISLKILGNVLEYEDNSLIQGGYQTDLNSGPVLIGEVRRWYRDSSIALSVLFNVTEINLSSDRHIVVDMLIFCGRKNTGPPFEQIAVVTNSIHYSESHMMTLPST